METGLFHSRGRVLLHSCTEQWNVGMRRKAQSQHGDQDLGDCEIVLPFGKPDCLHFLLPCQRKWQSYTEMCLGPGIPNSGPCAGRKSQACGLDTHENIVHMPQVMIVGLQARRWSSEWSLRDTYGLSLPWERNNSVHKQASLACAWARSCHSWNYTPAPYFWPIVGSSSHRILFRNIFSPSQWISKMFWLNTGVSFDSPAKIRYDPFFFTDA